MKTKTIVVLVLLTCGGLVIASVGCCSGVLFFGFRAYRETEAGISPRIDELFRAIDSDRFGETYVRDTTPEFQQITSRQQYEQLGSAIKTRLGALRSKKLVRLNTRRINAETSADVVYSATFEKGSGTIKATLKWSGDEWRFVGFRVDSPEFQKDLATATCPKCGKPHAAGAKFCPACGAALSESSND